jgi:hypothetical protein
MKLVERGTGTNFRIHATSLISVGPDLGGTFWTTTAETARIDVMTLG